MTGFVVMGLHITLLSDISRVLLELELEHLLD